MESAMRTILTELPKAFMLRAKHFLEVMESENLIVSSTLKLYSVSLYEVSEEVEYRILTFSNTEQEVCLFVLLTEDFQYETFKSYHELYRWMEQWYESARVTTYKRSAGERWFYTESRKMLFKAF